MSNSTSNVTNFADFGDLGLPPVFKTAYGSYKTETYLVSVSTGIHVLAEALETGIRLRTYRDVVSTQDIEKMLTDLLELRCLQVAKHLPASISPRDICVPDFFLPFLTHIVEFQLPLSALYFQPRYSPDVEKEAVPQDERITPEGANALKAKVDSLNKTVHVLNGVGVKSSQGLPRILLSDEGDDGLLRIQETEEGEFIAAGGQPSEIDFLVRSVIRIGFRPEYFGEPRTRYTRVADYYPSLYRIVEAAIPPAR